MFWLNLLYWAIATVLAEIIRPKPKLENARPAGLGDFNFPTATEGRPVPIVWGRVKVSGPNLIWYGNFRQVARTQEVKTGLFSSDDVIIGYRYYVGLQFALCRGPVDALHAVWVNDKSLGAGVARTIDASITIDNPNHFGGEEHGSGGLQGVLYFYKGSTTQAINSYLSGFQTPTPAYRGVCHLIYNGWVGNSTSIAPWSFEVSRIPDGLNLATHDPGAESPNTGYDANPMNVLYEILTDTDWGLSIPATDIDVTNFRAAASILADEGNGFAMVVDNELQVTDLIDEIQRQIDGSLFFNRATGQWQVSLARDNYDPGSIPSFDESDILKLTEFTRQTWEETSNQVRVAFVDSSDSYKSSYGLAQDGANISIQGYNVSSDVTYPGVKNKDLANALAWRDLRALAYPLAKVSFLINRSAFNLVPGSPFKISWARLGITDLVCRVGNISYGKLGGSEIEVFAVQDIFSTDVGSFSAPSLSGWTEPADEAVAVDTDDALALEAPRQMVVKDPYSPEQQPRVWVGAKHPGGGTIALRAYTRVASSRPIGSAYRSDCGISQFILTGTLDNDLAAYAATAVRPSTYNIDITGEDDLTGLEYDGDASAVRSLLNIAYIDGEYIGFEAFTSLGLDSYRIQRVYRGLFHTAPKDHAAGTRIWFLRGNLTRTSLTSSQDEMDVQLRSQDPLGQEVSATALPVTLSRLWQAPLAPRDPILHSSYAPASASVDTQYTTETGRTGEDARALKVTITPRDWLVDDVLEDATLRAEWVDDLPEFLYSLDLGVTVGPVTVAEADPAYLLRNDMIVALGANTAIPASGVLSVSARHTHGDDPTATNPVPMTFECSLTSALQGKEYIHGGVTASGSTGVVYTTTETVNFDIYSALPSGGQLQARLNGGSWATVVAGGASTGTLAVTSGDSVELRTTTLPVADQFFSVAGASKTGYGVLVA